MSVDYEKLIDKRSQVVFEAMEGRVPEEDMVRLHQAFDLARHAQDRKSTRLNSSH